MVCVGLLCLVILQIFNRYHNVVFSLFFFLFFSPRGCTSAERPLKISIMEFEINCNSIIINWLNLKLKVKKSAFNSTPDFICLTLSPYTACRKKKELEK